ncbi:hypothetical protein ANCCEY_07255 [Ancylostoma ceylanicum]|uniref:Reverse transcriptase domain-containing protein n=1 Tax=Ancylostoma ceylanicum TaxID=53326 RepID=A0A0D6M156_9BILA|nr:hypothetical protein ANCCEY_07255 [Ancylostoma ceylanicum]
MTLSLQHLTSVKRNICWPTTDDACRKIDLQLNLTKTMFTRNGWVPDAPFLLNGTTISECSSYVYLGREVSMMNDLAPELGRRKRAAWGAYKSIEDVVKKTKNTRLRAHLFNTTRLIPQTKSKGMGNCNKSEYHLQNEFEGKN